jgi:hypothetical protein
MAHDLGPTSHDASELRQRRHAVRVSAFLRAGGRRRSIEITSYSVDGFDRAAGIELDQRVIIELRSGERLPMRVVWIKGGEAGVCFLAAMAREHTVMRSLDLQMPGAWIEVVEIMPIPGMWSRAAVGDSRSKAATEPCVQSVCRAAGRRALLVSHWRVHRTPR